MKRFLLTSAVCVFAFSSVGVAQESTITIIHEDGHEDVIELGGSAPKAAPSSRTPKVEVAPKPARSVVFKDPGAVAEPVVEAAPVAPKIAPMPVLESEPKVVKKPAPKVVKKAAPKPQPKKKPKPKAVAKNVAKAKVERDVLAIVPPRKPQRRAQPVAGETISKDKALYIALSEAPPAKNVQVYLREGKAGLEYSVVFKTEEGAYEVVVDGATGVITRSGKVSGNADFVRPGHLPAR